MPGEADEGAKRGRYAKGIRRRREILERALEVFTERGVQGTSLRAIGEAIGVSHSALTHYFPSLEALYVEVLRERDVATERAVGPTGPQVDYMARAADRNVTEPGLVALHTTMMGVSVEQGDEVARDFFRARYAAGRDDIAEQLAAEYAAAGRVPDVDLELLASLLMAASDGLQVQWLLDPDVVDISAAVRLIQRIIASAPAAPPS
jgi:AcrR family transcriptional regulator